MKAMYNKYEDNECSAKEKSKGKGNKERRKNI
jgi:hypothetical protein